MSKFSSYILFPAILFTFSLSAISQSHEIDKEEPKPGSVVCSDNECYTIQKELGEGLFGKVFKVADSSNTVFAMKWYKHHEKEEFEGCKFLMILDDIKREFIIGQTLSHPHIIQSIDLFTDESNENSFLILDFVNGKTLGKTYRRSLSKEKAKSASLQLIDALSHALENGRINLDLHNNNLMFDQDANLMVIDVAGFFNWLELFEIFYKSPKNFPNKEKFINRFGPKKAKILEQFIKENPNLIDKINKEKKLQSKSTTNDFEFLKNIFTPAYFNDITEIIADIHSKSTMDSGEKVNLRSQVKQIAWKLLEDDADQIPIEPLENYFEKLRILLEQD